MEMGVRKGAVELYGYLGTFLFLHLSVPEGCRKTGGGWSEKIVDG